ncbi:cellulose-growth-specific protein [Punctularia strigosozonata HHB-11173 SS5]|uniref:cellulose-growth-specific protein n=1 Tax=Punctularia strigosozonata (strain HHB-11173) TaxID=741275 RepID=UPI0004417851|nr:cellulose-growth-specific protein [Punctularia strigosozonata HHB-11173 SS5]EIN08952.1 cellulose-growth-specific protein [Punctularia strigosozonata HHB-11173 SS5]
MTVFTVLSLVSVVSYATTVMAHGGVTSYNIAGKAYTGWQPYNDPNSQISIERPYSSYNPIMSATDTTISCNDDGWPSSNQLSATVLAGSEVTAHWAQWTHAQGPVMVYMASCGDTCYSVNTAELNWFKIAETGLVSGNLPNGVWGTGLVMNSLSYNATIPKTLAPGEYMIRHELLALHQANTPQFYPECAQLIVTGNGTATPPSSMTIKLPGGYSQSDPSINIDIYTADAAKTYSYTVPGPAVWTGE